MPALVVAVHQRHVPEQDLYCWGSLWIVMSQSSVLKYGSPLGKFCRHLVIRVIIARCHGCSRCENGIFQTCCGCCYGASGCCKCSEEDLVTTELVLQVL